MKLRLVLATVFAFSFCAGPVMATKSTLTAQQEKMSTCSKEAAQKELHGDQRKAFMKECLSGDKAKKKNELTAQQKKMIKCNKEAKTQALSGDKRKAFMSACLKN